MCATQNVAIKLSDHSNIYDDLLLPTNSVKDSIKSTLWFLLNLIWESRLRIPAVILLGMIVLNLCIPHEMNSRNLVRRRRLRDRNQGNVDELINEESDSEDDEENNEEDSDEDYEDTDDEDEEDENRLFMAESMLFIDPNINPESDAELFDFIQRENPRYERSLLRRQPLSNELETNLVLSRFPNSEENL